MLKIGHARSNLECVLTKVMVHGYGIEG